MLSKRLYLLLFSSYLPFYEQTHLQQPLLDTNHLEFEKKSINIALEMGKMNLELYAFMPWVVHVYISMSCLNGILEGLQFKALRSHND